MGTLIRDVRRSLDLLRREKGFASTVIFTLAVCVGANAAVFSIVHKVLLAPLPYPGADRLVVIFNSYPAAGAPRASNGSVDYFQRREHIAAFEVVAQYQEWGNTIGDPGETERIASMRVTPSYFPLVGAAPILGRTFFEEEAREGSDRVAILAYGYWRERYGADSTVVGRTIRVDGRPFAIVGVLGPDFRTTSPRQPQLLIPIPYDAGAEGLDRWHSNNFQMAARLAPGHTLEQARAESDALNERLIDEWPIPNARQILQDAGFHTEIHPAHEDLVRDIRPTLLLLWGGVAFVLLIGCVNIANIILARSHVRSRDTATRRALGAPRRRLAQEMLAHASVLALLGGTAGIGVAWAGIRLLGTLGADQLPRGGEIALDGTVVLFTLGLAIGAGLLFGSLPLYQLLRRDLHDALHAESRGGTADRGAVWLRSALVTGQVALAFLLLIGAGLMLESFRAANAVDPGFRADGLWSGFVGLPDERYPDGDSRSRFVDELLLQVRAAPGVRDASITTQLPFAGNGSSSVIWSEGYEPAPGESILSPRQNWASPGYFETLGIPLRDGRTFTDLDGREGGPRVIVLDEWLARHFFGDESAIGRRMIWGAVPGDIPEEAYYTVIGVVGAVKHDDLTSGPNEHFGAYYFPFRQNPQGFFSVVARTASDDSEVITSVIRGHVTDIDAELPVFGVQTVRQRIDASLQDRRTPMLLLVGFAAIALLLAVLGIYGVLAYVVAQQTREMGVRMAMGGTTGDLFRLVLGRGLRVALGGLVVGAIAALAIGRLLRSLLFQVQPLDPGVYVTVATILALVAVGACLQPARRAAATDPVRALSQG